jgi:hypothetical protein
MIEIDRALADLSDIRSRLAAGTLFQGFGPAIIATTGGLAIVVAIAQTLWPTLLADTPERLLAVWIAAAMVAAGLIGVEMIARSQRHHGGLSTAMIVNTIEQFLPAGFAGAVIGAVLLKFAPQNLWMLPGLWQLLVALGIFAAVRSLPRAVLLAAGWYFVSGTAVLILGSEEQTLSPWMMGVPFGTGQFLVAAVLHFAEGQRDEG